MIRRTNEEGNDNKERGRLRLDEADVFAENDVQDIEI